MRFSLLKPNKDGNKPQRTKAGAKQKEQSNLFSEIFTFSGSGFGKKNYKFLHVLMCNVKSESLQLRYGKLRGAACSEQQGGMIQADGHIC